MTRTSIELLVVVASRLVRLPKPIAFLGGATTGLLDALPGHLPGDLDYGRSRIIADRFRSMITLR